MKRISIVSPSYQEQQRIAEFLDRKCAEVDEMIALQEQIIEELKAYKQSVITEAVTKGLNPAAPMRDSGIEWIGSIPEHWEVRRIKFIGKAENGLTYSPNDVCDESEGILVLRSSNIQNGKLAFDDNVYVRSVPDSLRVRVGDIIICSRNGSASLVGKSALVDSEIDASFGAFMMRFRSNHNHKYIHFLLTATISHYKQLFTTTTINQLTIGLINNIAMPFVEDATEQQAIADYLDEKCADIDSLIQTKQSKIDSLKEYKKSIIYEYVTGKKEAE
jgi:type I restriction enzyme S subunit